MKAFRIYQESGHWMIADRHGFPILEFVTWRQAMDCVFGYVKH